MEEIVYSIVEPAHGELIKPTLAMKFMVASNRRALVLALVEPVNLHQVCLRVLS